MARFLYSQPDNALLYDIELPQTAYRLYNILVDIADKVTHQVTIKVSSLAKKLNRSKDTARRLLSLLVRVGAIERIFHKSKLNPKVNTASTFVIIGRHAKRYENSVYAGDYPNETYRQKCMYPTGKNDIVKDSRSSFLGEIIESNSKREAKTPLQVRNEKKEPEPERKRKAIDMAVKNVPDVMRPVAEYLLHKTGKFHFTAHEIEVLRSFVDTHTPLRVMKEIDTCCERFIHKGKNLRQLTFNYIGACLKNQRSLVKKAESRAYKKQRQERHVEAPVTQCDVQESVIIPESELSLPEAGVCQVNCV